MWKKDRPTAISASAALKAQEPPRGDFVALIETLLSDQQRRAREQAARVREQSGTAGQVPLHQSVAESFAKLRQEIARGATLQQNDINAANRAGELLDHTGHHHDLFKPRHEYHEAAPAAETATPKVRRGPGFIAITGRILVSFILTFCLALAVLDEFGIEIDEEVGVPCLALSFMFAFAANMIVLETKSKAQRKSTGGE